MNQVTSLLESKKATDVIYVDFVKAFVMVDIDVTLRKLKSSGIRGQLGR